MVDNDIYWLAGIMEGEGSFCCPPPSQPNSPIMQVQMKDEDVIARVSRFWGARYFSCRPRKIHHSITYKTVLRGVEAVNWMKLLRPLMSTRRKCQIDTAIAAYDPGRHLSAWRRRRKMTDSEIQEAVVLHKSGKSLREIGVRFNINHETVRRRISGAIDSRVSHCAVNAEFGAQFSVAPPLDFY